MNAVEKNWAINISFSWFKMHLLLWPDTVRATLVLDEIIWFSFNVPVYSIELVKLLPKHAPHELESEHSWSLDTEYLDLWWSQQDVI